MMKKLLSKNILIAFGVISASAFCLQNCAVNSLAGTSNVQRVKAIQDTSSPTYGWKETPFEFGIQKAYNVSQGDRYTYDKATDTHSFLLLKTDSSFKPDSKTSPRCELRMKNNYSSGKHQFEADYKVKKGSNHPIVMQIFGTDKPGFMLKAYEQSGGSFRQFDSKFLDSAIYDKWKHVNIVHDADEHSIKVYIDYTLTGTFKDKGASSHYFKCGLYTTQTAESRVEIRHLKYWTK